MNSRIAIFEGTDAPIRVEPSLIPSPKAGELLVRVSACTLCGSDMHTFEGRRSGPTPSILGHEILGNIVKFGPDAPRVDLTGAQLHDGQQIVWTIAAACHSCHYCHRGLTQKCLNGKKYGHAQLEEGRPLGGLSEHCVLLPGTGVIAVPEGLPRNVACPAGCATATVAAAFESAPKVADRNVAIIGSGLLGLTAAAMATDECAKSIVVVDTNHERLDLAYQFGATHAVSPDGFDQEAEEHSEGHGFDVVFEMSGQPASFERALSKTCLGGTILLVGGVFPSEPIGLALEQIVRRNLSIKGIHNYAPHHLVQAIHFLERVHNSMPFNELVERWFPLEKVNEAFEFSQQHRPIRAGIEFPGA